MDIYHNFVEEDDFYDLYENLKYNRLIVMLCTQASFYLPFKILNDIFTNPDKCIFLTDCRDQRGEIFITDQTDNIINIKLTQLFSVIRTHSEGVETLFNLKVNMDFNLYNYNFIHNIKKCIDAVFYQVQDQSIINVKIISIKKK
jgi:hypothetical protein